MLGFQASKDWSKMTPSDFETDYIEVALTLKPWLDATFYWVKEEQKWTRTNTKVGFTCTRCSRRNTRCAGCILTDHILYRDQATPYQPYLPNTSAAAWNTAYSTTDLAVTIAAGHAGITLGQSRAKVRPEFANQAHKALGTMRILAAVGKLKRWALVPASKLGHTCGLIGMGHDTFVNQVAKCDVPTDSCTPPRITHAIEAVQVNLEAAGIVTGSLTSETDANGTKTTMLVSQSHILYKNGATSAFEMCFAIRSQHLWCRVPTSQPKHVSNPHSAIKKVQLLYDL